MVLFMYSVCFGVLVCSSLVISVGRLLCLCSGGSVSVRLFSW